MAWRREVRTIGVLAALGVLAAVSTGCSGPLVEPNPYKAYSPPKYREHRALFLRPVKDQADLYDLKFPHEVQSDEHAKDLSIAPNDPISIVVSDVYMPPGFSGSGESGGARDVAVLLDVETSAERGLQSYALWYERGVRPGQRLNFTGALVYSDRAWNARSQPYFKLRVIDVSKERNEETRAALDGLEKTVGSLATFIPHPAIPGAAAAIRAAALVVANRANVSIVDYTPQFYGSEFIAGAKQSDLHPFMRGMWMVVGRAPGQDETFWNTPLRMHLKTGQIVTDKGAPVAVPYVRMTVSTFDAVVPTVVLDRSRLLFEFLAEKRMTSSEMVGALQKQVTSSIRAYNAHAQYQNTRTIEGLSTLITEANSKELTDEDRHFLLIVLRRVSGQPNASTSEISAWFDSTGRNGVIDQRSGQWEVRK